MTVNRAVPAAQSTRRPGRGSWPPAPHQTCTGKRSATCCRRGSTSRRPCRISVLSGFILGYRYPEITDRRAIGRFYWARFARVWPVHAFCVVVGVAMVPAAFWDSTDAIVWAILPLQVLLVNARIPFERFVWGFNAPAWSISVEWFFYVLYPLLILHWPRTWHWKLAGSILLLSVLVAIVDATAMPAAVSPEENRVSALALLYGNPLARLFEFTLGMSAALAWHRGHDRLRLSMGVATALELGLLGAIVADLYWTGNRATAWAATIGRPAIRLARADRNTAGNLGVPAVRTAHSRAGDRQRRVGEAAGDAYCSGVG